MLNRSTLENDILWEDVSSCSYEITMNEDGERDISSLCFEMSAIGTVSAMLRYNELPLKIQGRCCEDRLPTGIDM
jgi:hypothetical protein